LKENIIYFGESITGRRSNNEDSFLCEQVDDKTFLFIVADGMGGSEHGEVASQIAVHSFLLHIKESFCEGAPVTHLKSVLENGFQKTQTAIRKEIEEDSKHSGMGTTLVVLLIHNGSYVWGNIGDSRLYIIDASGIEQITRDHTYIEDVIRGKGEENVSQEHLNQYSHIITRSISGGNDEPDIYPEGQDSLKLNPGNTFLLCSDGLIIKKSATNNENEFYQNYQTSPDISSFTKNLINNAFDNGSNDNITAVCVTFGTNR
jgi:serine/threonine protein phosphatase PrpC